MIEMIKIFLKRVTAFSKVVEDEPLFSSASATERATASAWFTSVKGTVVANL